MVVCFYFLLFVSDSFYCKCILFLRDVLMLLNTIFNWYLKL